MPRRSITFYKTSRKRHLMEMAEQAILGKVGQGIIPDSNLIRYALLFTRENWSWARQQYPEWRERIPVIERSIPANGNAQGSYFIPRDENEALLEQVTRLTNQPTKAETVDMALLFLSILWESANRVNPEWRERKP